MITKLVSSKRAIAKVLADLDLSESNVRISDWREWIGEAVEKIGAITQYIPKVSGEDGTPILEINGHQVELPCDLHQLHSVAYSFNCNGPWKPMRKATGSFAVWGDGCRCKGSCDFLGNCGCTCCDCNPERIVQDSVLVDLAVDLFGNLDKRKALELINTNQNTRTILTNLINNHNKSIWNFNDVNRPNELQYSIKPGYIMTNVPCGYLKLSYSAVALDEEGYPLIPDMASFMEAVYWYIVQKYHYPKRLQGKIHRDDWYEMQNKWNFYRKQAYAEAIMPNLDELESIKNAWVELYPEMTEHDTFYNYVGSRQLINNHSL